jgi:hypothetical protein
MFVNGIPFLVSMAHGLNLVTAKHTLSQIAKNLAAGIKQVMSLYLQGGFHVGTVLMDNNFKKLKDLVPEIVVNTTTAKEYIPEVKQCIRLIKERGRAFLNALPYKKMPQVMLVELIYHVVLWLNAFPTKTGVSKDLLPHKILTCQKPDFGKHARAVFWPYCKVHNKPIPTITMVMQLTPSIVFGLTANLQGIYKFSASSQVRRSNIAASRHTQCPTQSSRRSRCLAH